MKKRKHTFEELYGQEALRAVAKDLKINVDRYFSKNYSNIRASILKSHPTYNDSQIEDKIHEMKKKLKPIVREAFDAEVLELSQELSCKDKIPSLGQRK